MTARAAATPTTEIPIGAHHTSCSAKIAAHSSQWPSGAAALALSRPVGEAQRRVAISGAGDRADGFCE